MKITADLQNAKGEAWNDEYDEDTVRYYEHVDDEGYFYELYVVIDGRKAAIEITEGGVWVEYLGGETIHTNIKPDGLFPRRDILTWPEMRQIIRTIESTGCEGKTFSRQEMEAMFQRWVDEWSMDWDD